MKKLYSYILASLVVIAGAQNSVCAMQNQNTASDQAALHADNVSVAFERAFSKLIEACKAAGIYVSETYMAEKAAFLKDGYKLYFQNKYEAAKKLTKDAQTKILGNKVIFWIGVTAVLHYILIRSGVWSAIAFSGLLLPIKLGKAVLFDLPENIIKDVGNTVLALLNKPWKQY